MFDESIKRNMLIFAPGVFASYLISASRATSSGLLILLWYYPHINDCLVCRQQSKQS